MKNRRQFLAALGKVFAATAAAPVVTPIIIEALKPKPLDLNAMLSTCNRMKAYRSQEYIDIMTDSQTAVMFQGALLRYYQEKRLQFPGS